MDYMPAKSKFNKLDDPDILRLASVKDMLFPIYNYEKLAHETKKNEVSAAAFDTDQRGKDAAQLSVRQEIRRAR